MRESAAPLPDREKLRGLLRALAHDAERLEMRSEDCPKQTGIILPETLASDRFDVVTLLPPEPLAPMLPNGQEVFFSGRLKGAELSFCARVLSFSPGRREWRFTLALPHKLAYVQRREAIRIAVFDHHPAATAVLITAEEALMASVTDLTRVGIGLRLRLPEARLPADDPQMHLEIGRDGDRIQAELHCVHQRIERGLLHFGGRLTPVDAANARRLDHLVIELERLWLRRRVDGPIRR